MPFSSTKKVYVYFKKALFKLEKWALSLRKKGTFRVLEKEKKLGGGARAPPAPPVPPPLGECNTSEPAEKAHSYYILSHNQ